MTLSRLAAALSDGLGREVARYEPLARHTTYRLGGPAALFVSVEDVEELEAVRSALRRHPAPVLLVGRGSNLLVAEAGFPGLALALGASFESIEIGDGQVTAGGAVPLPVLARRCAPAGWSGLEFFVGIPGSVGGAVRMNAGGHGRETAEVLLEARVFDLAGSSGEEVRPVGALDLAYRHSGLTPTEVVTSARFAVEAGDPDACSRRVEEIVRWRRQHQPGGANAGSVFTNPPGDSAGRIIDSCGLRGLTMGGAQVSEKHANFFQAAAGATADDVYGLIRAVQERVREQCDVRLVPELTLVGFVDDPDGPPDTGVASGGEADEPDGAGGPRS